MCKVEFSRLWRAQLIIITFSTLRHTIQTDSQYTSKMDLRRTRTYVMQLSVNVGRSFSCDSSSLNDSEQVSGIISCSGFSVKFVRVLHHSNLELVTLQYYQRTVVLIQQK